MTDNPDYEVVARGGAAYAGVLREIANERVRQIAEEGWTPEHDDEHDKGELADAAATYATTYDVRGLIQPWPISRKDRRSDLVKAAALLVAEIERIDRAAAKAKA